MFILCLYSVKIKNILMLKWLPSSMAFFLVFFVTGKYSFRLGVEREIPFSGVTKSDKKHR